MLRLWCVAMLLLVGSAHAPTYAENSPKKTLPNHQSNPLPNPPPSTTSNTPSTGQRWVLILTGLPGDDEHREAFHHIAKACEDWCTQQLGVPVDHLVKLPAGQAEASETPSRLTIETLGQTLDDLNRRLQPQDSLWVFTFGHGNYDGRRAWWHVSGKDPSAEDLSRLFATVKCQEQVFWLTHSSSGWFVKPLTQPGRIVIAATAADDEPNDTEFPHALATVLEGPSASMDQDHDQRLTLAELYEAVRRAVEERFLADHRLATEHAQLEDDGDGRGTEILPSKPVTQGAAEVTTPESSPAGQAQTAQARTGQAASRKQDGEIARKLILLELPPPPPKPTPQAAAGEQPPFD